MYPITKNMVKMAKLMKLEEMLEAIGPSEKETLCMSSKKAIEKIEEFSKKNGWGFVPDEYFLKFRKGIVRSIARGVFEPCVWEMVYNAVIAGNKYPIPPKKNGKLTAPYPHHDSHVILRLHHGERGIIAEIEDQGEGIPQKLIDMLDTARYDDFYYKDEDGTLRGCGFAGLKMGLDSNNLNAVGFNERRNAIYLMALYR